MVRGMKTDLLAPVSATKPSVTLKFEGTGRDVRLEEMIFYGYNGILESHRGKTTKAAMRVFRWGPGVRSMCLLFAKCARAASDPLASDVKLVGGERSPANSLDVAVAKSSELGWMSDMFGTSENGETVAKILFGKKNSYRKHKSQPVQVWVNTDYLPHDNIKILRDGVTLAAKELALLEEDIAADLMRSPLLDTAVTTTPRIEDGGNQAETFYDLYREIWEGADSLQDQILKTREFLGTATPRQYLLLLYKMRIVADEKGNADVEVDVRVCNWGLAPLERVRHEFRFDTPQPIPFGVFAPGQESLRVVHDDAHYKSFFVEFAKPLDSGATQHYQFAFPVSTQFKLPKWDFYLKSTNHILFDFVQATSQRIAAASVERVSDSGKEVLTRVSPVAVNWGSGIAVTLHLPFPEAGSVYRITWPFHTSEESLDI